MAGSYFRLCREAGKTFFSVVSGQVNRTKLFSVGSRVFTKCNNATKMLTIPRSLGLLSGTAGAGVGMGAYKALFGFSLSKDDGFEDIERLFLEAKTARTKNLFEDAEHLYHLALDEAVERFREKAIGERDYLKVCTNIYDSLADMALSQGKFEKAETLYIDTIKGCLELGIPQDDDAIMEISIKLASIYAILKKNDKAKAGFEHVISIQERKIDENEESSEDTRALLGLALESYGRYLLLQNQAEMAGDLFLRAIDIARETLGHNHSQTLILMNDYATSQIINADYQEAETTLKQAIELGLEGQANETAVLFCNLGSLYLRRAELTKAEEACREAIRLARRANDHYTEAQAERCIKKIERTRESQSESIRTFTRSQMEKKP